MAEKLEKTRISLDLPPFMNNKLDEIAKRSGTSKNNVLRKALALMAIASDAAYAGKHIGVVSDGNVLEKEFVGL